MRQALLIRYTASVLRPLRLWKGGPITDHSKSVKSKRPISTSKVEINESERPFLGNPVHGYVIYATLSGTARPSKKAVRLSTARMPMATRVSSVALPRCGSRTILSRLVRVAGTAGSPS